MALRVFTCPECNHQMRLGAFRCGLCQRSAPFMNVALVPLLFFGFMLLLSLMVTAALSI